MDLDLLNDDPELAKLLGSLDGLISEADMAAMNAQVDIDRMDARNVAHGFLAEHGLVEE